MNIRLNIIQFAILICIVSALNVRAQSIDSLLNEAYRNNPQLNSLKYKIDAAGFNAESVNTLPPPTLGIEFNSLSFDKLDIWNEALSQSLTISQMIPLGGKIGAMVNMAKTASSAAENDYEAYKVLLTSKIKMSYYTAWQIERSIEIQNRFIELMNDLLKANETLYQTNKLSQGEILMLQSEIASYETQLVILKNRRDIEISSLNKLIGRNIFSGNINIAKEIKTEPQIFDENRLIEDLKYANPSLKKMNSMMMMNKAEIVSNEKELIPDLMIGGMIMRMPKGMIVTSKTDPMMIGMGETEYMYGLMASITLPFAPWARGKYDAKTKELEAKIKAIEAEKYDMEREMSQKIYDLVRKMKNSAELMTLYSEKVIPLEQKYLELQKTSFYNNSAKLSSVIEANKMLLMNEMNLFMAQADYQMALADLEMMIGRQFSN